jgi:hypothetical protein
MSDGAAISTEATIANGGNITLSVGGLVYLVGSEITASVRKGNGGDINIASGLTILDESSVKAHAVIRQDGNITTDKYAGAYIASSNSMVSATGQIEINGITPLNGALVALSSELRNPAALTRGGCAERSSRPQSSLIEGSRGGLPQDPEATLPALYIAGRDVRLAPRLAPSRADAGGDLGSWRPPHTPAMAGSSMRRLRKTVVNQDGNVVTIPRLPPVAGADRPPGWNRWSAAGKVEHLLDMSLDRMAEILGWPADGLDPYRLAVQAQVMRVVAMIGAKTAERRFDHEAAERLRQAMERSGWRAGSDEPDK